MKAIDIVKPGPRTNLEAFERWQNRLQSELQSLPYYHKRQMEVKYIEKLDPSVCPPNSRGRATCERLGEHSWFNHSQDNLFGDLPAGFTEPV